MLSKFALFALLPLLITSAPTAPPTTAIPSLFARNKPSPTSVTTSSASPTASSIGFPYGQAKVRGVNLGGWLLLESWLTPALFHNLPNGTVDEWTFCTNQNRDAATAALQNHWNTFITQDDFYQIAAAGLNHVRLPIGFWAWDVDVSGGEPYIQGAKQYLYLAIGWARTAGIKIIIDLHGAPGSQNGYDNSGHQGPANWATQQSNIDRTKAIIQSIAQEFAAPQYSDVVTALSLLNEPAGYLNTQLLSADVQYTTDAYSIARSPWASQGNSTQSNFLVVYSDAFQAPSYWDGMFASSPTSHVALDHHHYQVFDGVQRTYSQHLSTACAQASLLQSSPNWPIVGEWSLATPQSGNLKTKSYLTFLRNFWDAQTQTFENNGQGWIFWTWKAPNTPEWSYQDGMRLGFIPKVATQHLSLTCS